MSNRTRRGVVSLAVLLVGLAGIVSWPSIEAQNTGQVKLGALGVNDAATANKIEEMGETFYALESKAKKVTTKFKDFEAVAERDLDGTLRSRLTRSVGHETSEVKAKGKELEIARQGASVLTSARVGVQPTLDWLNTQAYAIARDNLTAGQGLEWQQKYLRGRGKAGDDLEDAALEITHEYNDGIVAITKHNIPARGETAPHLSRNFSTEIFKDGVRVGQLRYFVDSQAFFWNLPGLTKGKVTKDTEQLKGQKGFPFRPTIAWANVQAYAFYTMHSKLVAEGKQVVSNTPSKNSVPQGTGGCAAAPAAKPAAKPPTTEKKSLVGRVLEAFSPTLYAQDGCTGLHWLDSTVYRPCCDEHDKCYEKAGCNRYSWFLSVIWGNLWACTDCNRRAVWCFVASADDYCSCCIEVGYLTTPPCCYPYMCGP